MMMFDTLGTKEEAKQFRLSRLKKIENEKVWRPMSLGPYCVLHWLPISEKPLFSIDDLKDRKIVRFIQTRDRAKTGIPNLDGIRFYSSEKDEIQKGSALAHGEHNGRSFWNAQVFHSGALEIALALTFDIDSAEVKRIPQGYLIEELRNLLDGLKKCMLHFNIIAPIIVGVSFLRISDCGFHVNHYVGNVGLDPRPDREKAILPGMLIENLEEVENIEEVEWPIFDMMWRSFGLEKCDYYDDDGKRKSPSV